MVTAVLLGLLVPLFASNLVFISEALLGLARRSPKSWQASIPRAVVVVPAHNEARVITRTLRDLTSIVDQQFTILVVADNCSDQTAEVSRTFAVTVVERDDPSRRGKGFALAFAREHLRRDPPACVIILDADCRTDARSLTVLAQACHQLQRPAQAINLLEPAPAAGPLVQLSCFAFLVKNLVRQRGLQRICGKVHLTGTGMALPWHLFDKADLATSSIVEDVRLGVEMGRIGAPPVLVEGSTVWSPHADQANTLEQRSRWEGGFLALARTSAPTLIRDGLRKLSPSTIWAGLDLLVPPLVLLVLADLLFLCGLAAVAAAGASTWLPFAILLTLSALAAIALLLAWWREGRAFLTPSALVRLPRYIFWKIPMYLRLARRGAPQVWNRTERSAETDREAAPPNG